MKPEGGEDILWVCEVLRDLLSVTHLVWSITKHNTFRKNNSISAYRILFITKFTQGRYIYLNVWTLSSKSINLSLLRGKRIEPGFQK